MFEDEDYMDMGETPQLKLTPSTLERPKAGNYSKPRFDSDSDDYADMSQVTPKHQTPVIMRKNSNTTPQKQMARKMTISSNYMNDDDDYAELYPASSTTVSSQESDYAIIPENIHQEVYTDMKGVTTRTTASSIASSLSTKTSFTDMSSGHQQTRPMSISITSDKRNNSAPNMHPSCHDSLYAEMSSPVNKRPHARSDVPLTKPPVYWKSPHTNVKTQSAKMHRKKSPIKVKTSESFRNRSQALSMSRDKMEELGKLSKMQQQRKRLVIKLVSERYR